MGKKVLNRTSGFAVLLSSILLLWSCTPNMESMGNTDSSPKEDSMSLDKQAVTYTPAIPSLDAAAPSVFETASFGLG